MIVPQIETYQWLCQTESEIYAIDACLTVTLEGVGRRLGGI